MFSNGHEEYGHMIRQQKFRPDLSARDRLAESHKQNTAAGRQDGSKKSGTWQTVECAIQLVAGGLSPKAPCPDRVSK